ncbi:hypothetical protein Drorol1_Dr00014721 [Drosera rotundifolia]
MNSASILKPRFRSILPFLPIPLSFSQCLSTASPKPLQNPKTQLLQSFNSLTQTQTHGCFSSTALVSSLKSCSSHTALFRGQEIHCIGVKTGLDSNIFVKNSLIHMYAKCDRIRDAETVFEMDFGLDLVSCNIMIIGYVKCGNLEDARKVFDEMPERGCVAYTTMIKGLVKEERWGDAVGVLKDMRRYEVVPGTVTVADVVLSYLGLGGVREGRMIHAMSVMFGLYGVLVSTNLLHMYCCCSSLEDAERLFDEMGEKNIVSWNVILNGFVKAHLVESAKNLFERIPEKDVVSWGTMIDAYVGLGRLNEALVLYRAMLRSRVRPNGVLIVNLMSACGQLMGFEGRQLHADMAKSGLDCFDFVQSTVIHFYASCGEMDFACLQFESSEKSHISSWNALMSGFVRNGFIEQARKIFDEMPRRDVFSWSSMISGYSQTAQPAKALELFHDMVAAEVMANGITMVSVISAIASLGTLQEGIWFHEYIRRNSIPLNDNLIAALINMYAKCGSITTALEFFLQIRDDISSVCPWNAVICGLAMHGHALLSLKIFRDLQGAPVEPNSITFIGVLVACCHAGLVEAGKEYFRRMMNSYKINPNLKHYGCMVDLLCRSGRLDEAEEMINSMPMEADVVIWGTLLAACKSHGNVEVGKRAADRLASLDTSHGAGRVLLSNLYADAEKWEDAFEVRKAMEGQMMTRLPGASGVV